MRVSLSRLAPVALTALLTAGCGLLSSNNDKGSNPTPTSPTPTIGMDAFAGVWTSATASTPPTGCGNVKYTVTPVSASAANVTFAATCGGGINVNGTGTGTLSGSALNWTAQGLVSQGGVNCPFTFTNGKATSDSAAQIVVTYSGTVCGIPVSGTETVKK